MLYSDSIIKLPLLHRGKVRDIYTLPDMPDALLFVTTDRISAYDVVMNETIPGKGVILNQMSLFWFAKFEHIIPNHVITSDVTKYPASCKPFLEHLKGRSMIVKKLKSLPIECIVRGRLTGSYFGEYKKAPRKRTESEFAPSFVDLHGNIMPADLKENAKFAEPIFTPSTKAELGDHDENISIDEMVTILGSEEQANFLQKVCIQVFKEAYDFALKRGIVIADTKFELGVDPNGVIYIIDEILTPDSSRFWPANEVKLGVTPSSFDKQFLRDWLSSLEWSKQPPPPPVPDWVIAQTGEKYREVMRLLTS